MSSLPLSPYKSTSRISPGSELHKSATNLVKKSLLLFTLNLAPTTLGSLGFCSLAPCSYFEADGEHQIHLHLSWIFKPASAYICLNMPLNISDLETSALASPP